MSPRPTQPGHPPVVAAAAADDDDDGKGKVNVDLYSALS